MSNRCPYGLTLDLSYRYYTQGTADFYSDLYPRQNSQNFLSRDKELSTFSSNSLGVGLTYEFGTQPRAVLQTRGVQLVRRLHAQFDVRGLSRRARRAARPATNRCTRWTRRFSGVRLVLVLNAQFRTASV